MTIQDLKIVMEFLYNNLKISTLFEAYRKYQVELQNSTSTDIKKSNNYNKFNESLNEIDIDNFTPGQIKIIEAYGIDNLFGRKSKKIIHEILDDNQLSNISKSKEIERRLESIENILKISNALVSNLTPFVVATQSTKANNEFILYLVFTGDIKTETYTEFKEWIDKWLISMRGFGLLFGLTPDQSLVKSISKSSPMIIEIISDPSLIFSIGIALQFLMNRIEQFYKIKKIKAETEVLLSDDEEIANLLQKKLDNLIEDQTEEIANLILQKFKLSDKKDGEIKNGLIMSIENVYNFVEKGGEIDIFMPESKNVKGTINLTDKELVEMKKMFDDIKNKMEWVKESKSQLKNNSSKVLIKNDNPKAP